MDVDTAIGLELEHWFLEQAPQLNALLADWAHNAAVFDEVEGWRGVGMRSCADWLVHHAGFGRPFAEALLRAGKCAQELPAVRDAFSSGELSLEKVRSLSTIATAENAEEWVEMAREASPPQLHRRCRETRNVEITDDPDRDRMQRRERRLRIWNDEGMIRLSGALPPEEGAIVQLAIERRCNALRDHRSSLPVDLDPPDDPFGALQADALTLMCSDALAGTSGTDALPPRQAQLVVHVDLGVLTGETPNGRGHIDNGSALSMAAIRRLGCDARIKTLIERDGVIVEEIRETRVVPAAMRRRVQNRDCTCRFPGCAVPAKHTQAHHLIHWAGEEGPTAMWNLVAFCEGHHHDHHRGDFEVWRSRTGDLTFVTPGGRVLGTATGGHWKFPGNYWRDP